MRYLSLVLVISFVLCPALFSADREEGIAIDAAKSWLTLVDDGNYDSSWQTAAPAFKAAVSKDQWAKALQSARAPFGKVLARTVKSATFTTTLPGVPDGQYVVIQFETSFEHKASAVETVTPSKGADGQWHVSGYYIR